MKAAKKDRTNKTVFGIRSDGNYFTFACLDNSKRLLVSRLFQWAYDRQTILRHIDRILLDAIQSSPHTTNVKLKNSKMFEYQRSLPVSWKFGEDSDEERERTMRTRTRTRTMNQPQVHNNNTTSKMSDRAPPEVRKNSLLTS